MEEKTPIKIYLTGAGGNVFVCSRCGLRKELDAKRIELARKGARIRCKCGEVYQLELRRCYRKEARLPARYKVEGKALAGDVLIEDISMSGVSFRLISEPKFKAGDILKLAFCLDDPKKTEIKLEAEVRHIAGNKVGAEFTDLYYHHKDLGFYLMP
ncbi:MAG: hypothetical protein COZ70_07060 [Deltaproteobacteria bacterium CG_4_8_14_3_um_filter_51_11]|nr:MAG: hypothetical protein AUK25_11710 [Desulfobacteraceae bacterium CG2_30_51_40]PIX19782.1 MAG: hypothetical protein COZ70_07060 [Deltaproteobacteria bacterium CG_4_8_14_3_um_filter_51_11]PIY23408.1 MAG: hypothetical protein COZ11_09645 [Deltaproteobacteria bacterium CG_4_10_14_3_um_filter_51_14]